MIRFLPGLLIASVLALFQVVSSRFSISSLDANLFTIPLQAPGWLVDPDASVWDLLHWLLAVVLLVSAGLRIQKISRENHAVRDESTRKPNELVTSGSYAQVRHPMYAMSMMNILALFCAFGTLLGVGVALLLVSFQYLNGVMEEQHQLVPLFGPAYEAYRKAVPRKYFTTAQLNLLICYLSMTLLDVLL